MLKIGEVANRTGFGPETIRYYEHAGVLPPPHRAENGYRLFDETHVRRLRFVRRCRELGFSLEKVRSLLALSEDGAATCSDVKAVAAEHLADIRTQIADLQIIARVLEEVAGRCAGDDSPECPILDALFNERPPS